MPLLAPFLSCCVADSKKPMAGTQESCAQPDVLLVNSSCLEHLIVYQPFA
jgi:hypothetical protein